MSRVALSTEGEALKRARDEILRLHMKLRTVRCDIAEVERQARGEIRRLEMKLRTAQSEIAAAERDARKAAGVAGRVVWARSP